MIIHADCILAMSEMEPSSIDAIICDPPYGLEFMNKEWDSQWTSRNGKESRGRGRDPYTSSRLEKYQAGSAFQAWVTQWATEALRVLKPGGSLLSFGGTRTFHRLTCGLEDAGFIIKDCLMYLYGAGFPKSQDAANMIRKRYCRCGEQETEHDLRPVQDSDLPQGFDASDKSGEVLFEGLQESGLSEPGATTGNGDAGVAESSMEGRRDVLQAEGQLQGHSLHSSPRVGVADGAERLLHNGTPPSDGNGGRAATGAVGSGTSSRPRSNEQRPDESGALAIELGAQESGVGQVCSDCGKPICPDGLAEHWDGYKIGGIKPAWEPIIWAVKPPEGAWIDNVLTFGTGAVNVDECRIAYANENDRPTQEEWNRLGSSQTGNTYGQCGEKMAEAYKKGQIPVPKGRFPANLLLDEEAARLLDEQSGECKTGGKSLRGNGIGGGYHGSDVSWDMERGFDDTTGGASRFFYTSKATDRDSYNDHPTLKPTDLVEWLIRLVTRPGQLVLDPFAGSGTTGVAAIQSGREFILIEQDEHYIDICERRTTDGAQQGMF